MSVFDRVSFKSMGGGGKRNNDNDYRDNNGGDRREFVGNVGGRRNRKGGKYKSRNYQFLANADVGMRDDFDDSNRRNHRSNPYSKNRPNKKNKNKFKKRFDYDEPKNSQDNHDRPGPSTPPRKLDERTWRRVMVMHGRKLDKDQVLNAIHTKLRIPFTPIFYHLEEASAVFYLEDGDTGDMIRALSQNIIMPDGQKLIIKVFRSGPPVIPISAELKIKIKLRLSDRFNAYTKNLNLSGFHKDSAFLGDGLYAPLDRPNVMQNVLKIVEDNVQSDLFGLDLSGNKLETLHLVGDFARKKLQSLKVLLLNDNRFSTLSDLDRLKDLPVEELNLDNNPLCTKFSDQASYISAVRKIFPKVMKLDGMDIPPPIGFDVETLTAAALPDSRGSFFATETAKRVMVEFLQQYFGVYDAGATQRQNLLNAYHEDALYSLSAVRPHQGEHAMHYYMPSSRNFMKLSDSDRRHRLLRQGRADVVGFLVELPETEHDPNSFIVDVALATDTVFNCSVTGVFCEKTGSGSKRVNRERFLSFHRTMLVVAQGSGYVILNELVFITGATHEQQLRAFKTPAPTPSHSPVIHQQPDVVVTSPAMRQAEMVNALMQLSGMKESFTRLCLEEHLWDYDRALTAFYDLQRRKAIPPEAFMVAN